MNGDTDKELLMKEKRKKMLGLKLTFVVNFLNERKKKHVKKQKREKNKEPMRRK